MSSTEMERAQLALDEREGVIIADATDPAYDIAVNHAYRSGRALRRWNFSQPPPSLAHDGGSITLVASWPKLDNGLIQRLRSSLIISGERARAFGIITGLTIEAIEKIAQRADTPPSPNLSSGWILAGEKLLSNINCSARQLAAEELISTSFLQTIAPTAEFGVVAGHGREDICYFNSFAICGQSTVGGCLRLCHPDSCPYKQSKVYADQVEARIIALISCSAGRIGKGLFPADHRLFLSILSGSTTACLAPRSLFTLTPGLVEYVTSLLEIGLPIGEIARRAGIWHEKATGEIDPFLLFGDPEISPKEHAAETHPTQSLQWQIANNNDLRVIEDLTYKLGHIYDGIETLERLDLLPEIDSDLNIFDNQFEKTLIRLIKLGPANPRARYHLEKIWSQIEIIKDEIEYSVINHLTEQAFNGYLWLESLYPWYSLSKRQTVTCLLCGSSALEEELSHPFRPLASRIRVTCSRCGITEDRPLDGRKIGVNKVNSRGEEHEPLVLLDLSIDAGESTGVLNVAINNGQGILRQAKLMSKEQVQTVYLPSRISLHEEEQLCLNFGPAKPGVYFVKIFWMEDLQLTIASAPIGIFPHGSRQS